MRNKQNGLQLKERRLKPSKHGELQTSTYAPGLLNCRPYCFDEASHRPVLRIISRSTHELVPQLPAEAVLRLLEQLAPPSRWRSRPR